MKTIAFYLPQFHPIPENDKWWGKGFTEWTNVTRAYPLFSGHNQPRLPADLGFYDLRLAEVRNEQTKLARQYGLYGFCYHYYWFAGKKLLDLPLTRMLETKEPDFPFCICYANENWTRRWDGQEDDILMKQEHGTESDRAFIHDVIKIFKDERYIKIKNRPVMLVYRTALFPDMLSTTRIWREEAKKAGFDDLYLCKCQTFGDFEDPSKSGFDACVEFPPHGLNIGPKTEYENAARASSPHFNGRIFDYEEAALQLMTRQWPEYKLFKTVMLGWDNSARKGLNAHIFHNFSVEVYERWLSKVMKRTVAQHPVEERFVFVNAWNEWAEGTYLEPDQRFGHEYLAATGRAIASARSWEEISRLTNEISSRTEDMEGLLDGILSYMENREATECLLVKAIEKKEAKIMELEAQLALPSEGRFLSTTLNKWLPRGTRRRHIIKKLKNRFFDA